MCASCQVFKCLPASSVGRSEGNVSLPPLPKFYWMHPKPGGGQPGNTALHVSVCTLNIHVVSQKISVYAGAV